MLTVNVFTFSPIQENTYIISNEQGEAIIIDPGCYFKPEEKTLQNFFIQSMLTPVCLLNTHCHLDHVFGNKWVAETYNLIPHIHPDEEKMLELAELSGEQYGLPFKAYSGPLHYVQHDYVISLGEDTLKVIAIPGHSPGSIGFYNSKQHFIISGDALFKEGIGRTDLPGGNHEQLLQSIREQLFVLPDETTVYSGHGGHTTIGHEKKNNMFLR